MTALEQSHPPTPGFLLFPMAYSLALSEFVSYLEQHFPRYENDGVDVWLDNCKKFTAGGSDDYINLWQQIDNLVSMRGDPHFTAELLFAVDPTLPRYGSNDDECDEDEYDEPISQATPVMTPTIEYRNRGRVLYVKIPTFMRMDTTCFIPVIRALRHANAKRTVVHIDMTGNNGGLIAVGNILTIALFGRTLEGAKARGRIWFGRTHFIIDGCNSVCLSILDCALYSTRFGIRVTASGVSGHDKFTHNSRPFTPFPGIKVLIPTAARQPGIRTLLGRSDGAWYTCMPDRSLHINADETLVWYTSWAGFCPFLRTDE